MLLTMTVSMMGPATPTGLFIVIFPVFSLMLNSSVSVQRPKSCQNIKIAPKAGVQMPLQLDQRQTMSLISQD